jgi:hypothetical protein
LVLDAHARRLIPYLADAVPGWFKAVMSVYDSSGNEVAYDDDYHFQIDPVIFFKPPADGEYKVTIRDSIYRGREDFVYRIAVGELPFVTRVWPMGGRIGTPQTVDLIGYNLPATRLALNTHSGTESLRQGWLGKGQLVLNPIRYAVDTLPEVDDAGANGTLDHAQPIALGTVVNGVINQPGEVHAYRFEARAGTPVVLDVEARRLGSLLDSVVRLFDAHGKLVGWNDDAPDPEQGVALSPVTGNQIILRYADSYLLTKLPADGSYFVTIADVQHHGGPDYGYRLRVSLPQPDFALRVTPSTLNCGPNQVVEVVAHVVRRDGFDGEVEVTLDDGPPGSTLIGGVVPAGRNEIRMTYCAPDKPVFGAQPLHFSGHSTIGTSYVTRPGQPAEDWEEAFLYRHINPTQELLVNIHNRRRFTPPVLYGDYHRLSVPVGGTAQLVVRTGPKFNLQGLHFELSDPPKGVTLEETKIVAGGLGLIFKADAKAKAGFSDNLIVEVFNDPVQGDGKRRAARYSLGIMPAVPIQLVAPGTPATPAKK